MKPFLRASILLAIPTFGCTHDLRIDNPPDTSLPSAHQSGNAMLVGVINHGRPEMKGYVEAPAPALQLQTAVERVIYPYAKGTQVDALVHVKVNPEYRGADTNSMKDQRTYAWPTPRSRESNVLLVTPNHSRISWAGNWVWDAA